MEGYLTVSLFGVVISDEKNRIVSYSSLPRGTRGVVERLSSLNQSVIIPEIEDAIKRALNRDIDTLIIEDEALSKAIEEQFGVNVKVKLPSSGSDYLRADLLRLSKHVGRHLTPQELRAFVREVSLDFVRDQLRKSSERRDLLVIQAIETLSEINKNINMFTSRLREYYGSHFPEINRLVTDHEILSKIVSNIGSRKTITADLLVKEYKIPEGKAQRIAQKAETSVGAPLTDDDLKPIRSLAYQITGLYEYRRFIERYIESVMKQIAPNVSYLIGPLIAARLISSSGGIDRLARMPSSTIQVLGAEKALFRSKRTGTRPPKHGIIYQFADVHGSKRWQRGKISRILAGKLSIAARVDAYSGEFIGDKLREAVEKRVEEVRKKFKEAPTRKPRPAGKARIPKGKAKGKTWSKKGKSERKRRWKHNRKRKKEGSE